MVIQKKIKVCDHISVFLHLPLGMGRFDNRHSKSKERARSREYLIILIGLSGNLTEAIVSFGQITHITSVRDASGGSIDGESDWLEKGPGF